MEIDRRQLNVEVDKACYKGDNQIDENVFAGKAGFSHKRRSFRTLQ